MTAIAAIQFETPELREGASSSVMDSTRYCGSVARERHESGIGWTFRAMGPYGNATHGGFFSATDAALWLAGRNDFGQPI